MELDQESLRIARLHSLRSTVQPHQPRYRDRHGQAVIDKLRGCGPPESGYTTSLCPHGLEATRVAFSCQSRGCLACCQVDVDEGVAYRHTGLTMPDALPLAFDRDRPL